MVFVNWFKKHICAIGKVKKQQTDDPNIYSCRVKKTAEIRKISVIRVPFNLSKFVSA